MRYFSTRDSNKTVSGPQAIIKGLSEEGGLFVPDMFIDAKYLLTNNLSYSEICNAILNIFFPELDLKNIIENSYKHFYNNPPLKLSKVGENFVCELYHGPTCAFKDFALVLLPFLLEKSLEIEKIEDKFVILTATSGDTGSAALNSFSNINGEKNNIDIVVIYPSDGVSEIQKRQMTSQLGDNISVIGIKGNFDDAQTAVKEFFLDEDLKATLKANKIRLSSANSINIGRLIPQIVYYFFTYKELVNKKEIKYGEEINFCVPTGNFGNILAGYYAKKMGLPIKKLICASNENNVLYDFLQTGIYNKRRELKCTISPSMDIIISSNIERLLYHISEDDKSVLKWMNDLKVQGFYNIFENEKNIELYKSKLECFVSGYSEKESAKKAINDVFNKYNYLMDTHTAVAWDVGEKYKKSSYSNTKMVILSTASPYKFANSVCEALGLTLNQNNDFDILRLLSKKTQTNLPIPLFDLENKEIKHKNVVSKNEIKKSIKSAILTNNFTVRIPATTANIGPGFDTLGIALNLYTTVDVKYEGVSLNNAPESINLTINSSIEKYSNKNNLIYRSFLFAMKKIEEKSPILYPKNLSLNINSEIPISRGLGSSAACIVAGVVIAYKVSKTKYKRQNILDIANEIEGHPDNIAPAIFGGFLVSVQDNFKIYTSSVFIADEIRFIAIVPNFTLSTRISRGVLPNNLTYSNAIHNISRTAMLISAFNNRDYQLIPIAISDKLHQDYRGPLINHYDKIFKKCEELGALGVYLSGAGPTIIAIDNKNCLKKYEDAIKLIDDKYKVYNLKVDKKGLLFM